MEIRCHSPLSPKEEEIVRAGAPEDAAYAVVEVEGDDLAVSYFRSPPRFERIRRITGYLVGTLDRFNDAKRAEERDRVKHLSRINAQTLGENK